ncbi:MAG TPA: HEPN family nuclease [Macellibacteroides fermentans]|uniref:HEPN family nuclease n=1 Tax=Macellibacteroides fermentans TaxID=879969 RepID=UPI002B9A2FA0|nr:HEPN family nuclease [Macellibacteroides fermentans]
MSHYNIQEVDFIYRTKKIIEQYDRFQIEKAEKYEVTLLLNCLVGLLILPQQHWFDSLPINLISQKEWGINPNHIIMMKNGETKNVKDIARHLRNSISHYKFKAFENKATDISSIKFEDFDKQENKTFEAIIPILGIRQFTTKLTDIFTDEIEKTK